MAKILVTGGNGFLGRWTVRRLLQEGNQVTCLLRPQSSAKELEGLDIQRVTGDVTHAESLQKAIAGHDAVFHLAGLIAYKSKDRKKMEQINVRGTQNVVTACLKNPGTRLLHVSSVVAVGAGFDKSQILNEESEYNMGSLNLGYFETKHQAEILVKNAVLEEGLNAVIVNPATIYGPGDATKGSRKTQVKVARGEFRFYTAGGVNVVPVENCVEGMWLAFTKGRVGERYILGGENVTIRQLFEWIAETAGVAPPTRKIPTVLLHVMGFLGDLSGNLGGPVPISRENAWTATLYHWFDSSKAQKELGFKPGSARDAVRNSVVWMKENGYLD